MFNSIISFVIDVLLWILPFPVVFFIGWAAWKMWLHYIQQNFISGIDWVLLEVIPPREVLRSPKGMELFLNNALYHWSMKGGLEQYWQGAVWFWFSLEIVSIGGQVHFYIRTPTRVKDLIETQIYAQYPQAQVKVVDDYTLAVDEISPESKWNLWGCEWELEKSEVFPLKTYVDYGLDKDPKEEYKVDPISGIIELFGSIHKEEQMWMQIVVRPSKKKFHDHSGWFRHHDWVREGEIQLEKIALPYTKFEKLPNGAILKSGRTPDYLKPLIDGVNKKITKIGFDTGIRTCYVAPKSIFPFGSRTNNSRNIRLLFRPYDNPFSNSLKRVNSTQGDAYSGYWVASTKTIMKLSNRMLEEYRERSFFYSKMRHQLFNKHTVFWPFSILLKPFFHSEYFVLNVEELASLWHFPGQILKVPTLERIESKEASPPTNLPI